MLLLRSRPPRLEMLLLGVRLGARDRLRRPEGAGAWLAWALEPLKGPKARSMSRVVAAEREREREGARSVEGAREEGS